MKAWVLHGINDIRFETVDSPVVNDEEVLVEVKAVGICGSDIPRIYETGAHAHPVIVGHEFSGTVVELGPNAPDKWLGKRVGIYPLIPCKKCLPCQKGIYEMCRQYGYLGSRRDGGFAEYVAVPVSSLVELPAQITFEEAAMLEPMAVAVHAMKRTMLPDSGTIAVCGLGTIGLSLLMFLLELENAQKDMGSQPSRKIFAIGNKDFQHQMAMEIGLSEDCYCDTRVHSVEKWISKHTDGKGVDTFFECVGKNETLVQAVNNAAPLGKVVLVGNPFTDMLLERNVYWKILRNQLIVTGTWNSSLTDDWQYVLDKLSQKKIAPLALISHRFSLGDMKQGLEIMHNKSEDYVKIMGIVNQ